MEFSKPGENQAKKQRSRTKESEVKPDEEVPMRMAVVFSALLALACSSNLSVVEFRPKDDSPVEALRPEGDVPRQLEPGDHILVNCAPYNELLKVEGVRVRKRHVQFRCWLNIRVFDAKWELRRMCEEPFNRFRPCEVLAEQNGSESEVVFDLGAWTRTRGKWQVWVHVPVPEANPPYDIYAGIDVEVKHHRPFVQGREVLPPTQAQVDAYLNYLNRDN